MPDQAPEAAQLVASVEDQVRVDAAPLVTLAGLALIDSVAAWALTAHTSAMTGSAAMRNRANKFFLREIEIGFITVHFLKFIGVEMDQMRCKKECCSLSACA